MTQHIAYAYCYHCHYLGLAGNSRRGGKEMDNEPIFTEYELSLKKAREEANELAREANELLAHHKDIGINDPAKMTLYAGTYAGKDMSQITYDQTQGEFVPVDPDYNLHTPTMTFITPEELKRRDAENVKRLQEISGK